MTNDIALRAYLEKLLTERNDLLAKLRDLDISIERVQRELGEPTIERFAAAELSTLAGPPKEILRQPSQVSIRADQFYGKSQSAAAEAYLKMLGHAVSIDEILAALTKGGVKIGGDARKNLYTALVKATKKFVLVSPYTFGLREFYPSSPKLMKKNRLKGKARRKKRGKKLKARGKSKERSMKTKQEESKKEKQDKKEERPELKA